MNKVTEALRTARRLTDLLRQGERPTRAELDDLDALLRDALELVDHDATAPTQ